MTLIPSEPFRTSEPGILPLSRSNTRTRNSTASRPRPARPVLEVLEDRVLLFKPFAHLAVADEALLDAIDNGQVTIGDRSGEPLAVGGDYAVNSAVADALRTYPQFFRAGVIGPDGLPDLPMGQAILHPDNAGLWLRQVYERAWQAQSDPSYTPQEKGQILAWSYGFLAHSAGDVWAHTLMNDFADGIFPPFAELPTDRLKAANALRHILTENYLNDATPFYDGISDRTFVSLGDPDRNGVENFAMSGDISDVSTPTIALDAPHRFIFETLIDDPSVQLYSVGLKGTLPVLRNQLTEDATFSLTIDRSRTVTVTVLAADTGGNASLDDLVADVNTALQRAGLLGEVTAGVSSLPIPRTLMLSRTKPTSPPSLKVQANADNPAITELHLPDAKQVTGEASRGILLDRFYSLRETLRSLVPAGPDNLSHAAVEESLRLYNDTRAAFEAARVACVDNFELGPCLLSLGTLGKQALIDNAEAFTAFRDLTLQDLLVGLRDAYIRDWIQDIDVGLERWSEFGLAVTRGLFDPQARRNTQNDECDTLGPDTADPDDLRSKCEDGFGLVGVIKHEANDFINDHLLAMLGAPDFVAGLREALQNFSEFLDERIGTLFNPLRKIQAELREAAFDLIKQGIQEAFGISVDALQQFLDSPSSWMDVDQVDLGPLGIVPLFCTAGPQCPQSDHERLDALLGLPPNHHLIVLQDPNDPNSPTLEGGLKGDATYFHEDPVTGEQTTSFAAYTNAVTFTKLLLLDGVQLNQLLVDLAGAPSFLYPIDGNIMITPLPAAPAPGPLAEQVQVTASQQWLYSIDSDHAWRADGQPRFNLDRPDVVPGKPLSGGLGNFPLWEDATLRDSVFRVLFQDWENDADNFPNLQDEPSSLLSDPLTAPGVAPAIRSGLEAFVNWVDGSAAGGGPAASVDNFAELAKPLLFVDKTVGSAVQAADLLERFFLEPVAAYFAGDPTPTSPELVSALKALNRSQGDVTVNVAPLNVSGGRNPLAPGSELLFHIVFDATRTTRDLPVQLAGGAAEAGFTLDDGATVDVIGSLHLDLTFGITLPSSASPEQQFFLRIDQFRIGADIHEVEYETTGRVGTLGVAVRHGTIDLDADVSLTPANPDGDAAGHLSLAELQGSSIAALIAETEASATLNAALPIGSDFGSCTGGAFPSTRPSITETDSDLFDETEPAVTTGNFENVQPANRITTQSMLDLLHQLNDWLGGFRDSSVFDTRIPFTRGTTLGEVFDVESAFVERVIARLESSPGTPAFSTAQQLAEQLAAGLGIEPSVVDGKYNCLSDELSFHVRLHHEFAAESIPIDFSVHAGTLAELTTSSTLDLEAEVTLEFDFGIDLSAGLSTDNLTDRFFVDDVAFDGELNLMADDIDLTARIGSIGMHIDDGTASVSGSIALQLKNPTTGEPDGRVTLRELLDGLGDVSSLVTTPDIDLAANFSLVVSADPFNLGGVSVALSGLVSGTDAEIDFTMTAAVAGTIVSGLVIEPLPSGGPSRVTFTKGDGLELDARAKILSVGVDLAGTFHATDDFSITATSDRFDIGGVDVELTGNVSRQGTQFDWELCGNTTSPWEPLPFLTIDMLRVCLDRDGISFDTTLDVLSFDDVRLRGDFDFSSKSFEIMADAALDGWRPVPGVDVALNQVFFAVSNRNADGSKGNVRLSAGAETRVLGTDFVAAVTVSGADPLGVLVAARPKANATFQPLSGIDLGFDAPVIAASTHDTVVDLDSLLEVPGNPSNPPPGQRRVTAESLNFFASTTVPDSVPTIGGSFVEVTGVLSANLAETRIEGKINLAEPWVAIPDFRLFEFHSVGLFITGVPSVGLFVEGVLLDDEIPSLGRDLPVKGSLTIAATVPGPTLSGSLELLERVDNVFGIDGLNMIRGAIEVGINFGTTPIPTLTGAFDVDMELPEFARERLNLPATIAAAGKLDAATPILAIAVEDWFPFEGLGLGLDDLEVREAELAIAPNGGMIGSRVFDRGFSAKFVADIFDTEVRFAGLYSQIPPAIKLEAYVSDFQIGGVEITGAGPDGIYQDGHDTGTPIAPDPDADNGAYFKLDVSAAEQSFELSGRINLPGDDESGRPAFVALDGAFNTSGVVLNGAIQNWEPLPGIVFNGEAHAEIAFRTVALELGFSVDAAILGAATHFEGQISASPSGIAIFATGTLPLGPAGGPRLVDLAATLDIGVNSPFFIELAADFKLPGSRPADVQLEGGIGTDGVEIFADIQNWELVPGLAFDGMVCIDVGGQSESCEAPGAVAASVSDGARRFGDGLIDQLGAPPTSSDLVFRVDVSTRLLGSRLALSGTYVAGPNGPELDLAGDIHFGGKRLGMASVDLTAEMHVGGDDDPFELDFHGKLKLIEDLAAIDVTAEVNATDAGGFAMLLDASVNFHPNLSLAGFTVRLDITLGAHLEFGVNPTFAAASLSLSGRACVSVSGLGEQCTGTVGLSIRLDTGQFVIKNVKPQITHNKFGIPTGVKWKDITRTAADTSEPRVTVEAKCRSLVHNTCGTIEVTGTAAAESVRAFQIGNNIVVQTQNSVGEWVQLIQQPVSKVTAISVDLKGGNDSIDLDERLTLPGVSIVPVSVPVVLRGGTGRDVIRGGNGANTIYGGTGSSVAASVADSGGPRVAAGRPPFVGGGGILFPGGLFSLLDADKDDQLFGGPGVDAIYGEAGNDSITSGLSADAIDGGSGVNLIDGRLEVRGTDRPERIRVFRDHQTETICIDLPFGGGQQCFTITTVDDIVVQSASGAAPAITLGRIATGGVTSLDVDARGGNDRIEIDSNITVPAVLHGGAGHDAIQGGSGIDSTFGDSGIDLLIGDSADLLDGGAGSNITLFAGRFDLMGTAGPERFELSKTLLFFPCGPAGIISFPPCQDAVRVRAINEANGETATFLVPLAAVSSLHANLGDGDDTIIVAAVLAISADFDLGPGDDFVQAGSGPTTMHGDDGDDQLMGGLGNDAIFGEADDDTITCGGGSDELDGGPGTNDVSCGDNHPPAIDPIGDYSVDEGSTLTFTVTAADPDNEMPGDPTDEPPLPTFMGPMPYLDRTDSPFGDKNFSYFHLEDFEDGELNVPGVTASAGAPFGPSVSLPPDLVSQWRAEGNATDSADDNDGTLQNGATFTAGQVGQAFSFDGVDDQVVVSHNANQNTGGQITIDAWINQTSSGHGRPIAQKRSSSNVGGYTFETTHSPFGPDNGLQFGIWIAGTLHLLQTPANALTVGAWQHVAATFDQAMMRIYVNGVEQTSTSVPGTIDAVTYPFVIGRNVVIPSFAWHGFIDELGIYNRALSPSEIEAIVNRDDASAGEQTTYSVSGDFSRVNNPAGAWSYGTIQQADPTVFTLFDRRANSDGIDGWHAPEGFFGFSDPAVLHNGTDSTQRSGSLGECLTLAAGQLALHPGFDGRQSVVRFTAPAAGDYSIDTNFTSIDCLGETTVTVRHGQTSLFDGTVGGDAPANSAFALTSVSLAAGETIDFSAAFAAGGFTGDSVALDATITQLTGSGNGNGGGGGSGGSNSPDSVDGDDGEIDGDGSMGHSFEHTSAATGITFSFDAETLGGLPTHVGIVWTDGGSEASDGGLEADVTFEAFDAAGNSLGTILATDLGDAGRSGTTGEDRFFGVTYRGGIAMVKISDNDDGKVEVDHLQYGRVEPEPLPPARTLTFSLDPGAPAGAMIDPETGVFTWTPTEIQGPRQHSITVRVADDGTPSLNASRTFVVSVNEVNEPPVLANIFNQTASQAQTLRFTAHATDPDRPTNRLDFSLDAGAPVGAAIDERNGEFTWTPSADIQPTGDYEITVRVTDRGSPALSDSQTITITVEADVTPPTIDRVKLNSNDRLITEIIIFASESLDPDRAADVANYHLIAPGNDRELGTPDDVSSVPTSAVYDAAAGTVLLVPAGGPSKLYLNQLFEIIVTSPANPDAAGITDLAGNALDGDRNETAGGDYVAFLARSNDRLAYRDRSGDTVSLMITRGVMDLLLGADGEAIHLSLHDGPGTSALTGRVRTRNNNPSTTTIRLVTGTDGIQGSLLSNAFDIEHLSAAAVDALLASGKLSTARKL